MTLAYHYSSSMIRKLPFVFHTGRTKPSSSILSIKGLGRISSRSNSSNGGSGQGLFNRAFADYRVYGEECALSMQPWMPTYREAGQYGGGLSLQQAGNIRLGFTPRNPGTGKYQWNDSVHFRMTVEEIGFILSQVPNSYQVEICRKGYYDYDNDNNDNDDEDMDRYKGIIQTDVPDKVLTITPQAGSSVLFKADMVLNGNGGQSSPPSSIQYPLIVHVQAGEFEVMKELLRFSIPHLTGWNVMMNISTDAALHRCKDASKITNTNSTTSSSKLQSYSSSGSRFSGQGSDGPISF